MKNEDEFTKLGDILEKLMKDIESAYEKNKDKTGEDG